MSNAIRFPAAQEDWEARYYEDSEPAERPWKKIALAVALLTLGSILLTLGLVEWYEGTKGGHAVALIVLGTICFLPGFYHVRIAYYAWRGYRGYSFTQIPDI